MTINRARYVLLRLIGLVLLVELALLSAMAVAGAVTPLETRNNLYSTGSIISFLVGTGLPLLVAVVTTNETNQAVKALILAFLSGVSGVLSQYLESLNSHLPFAWQSVVLTAVFTFATGVLTHYTVYRKEIAPLIRAKVGVKTKKPGKRWTRTGTLPPAVAANPDADH